jgi:diguanylate cyclase (GGDEF)-like protein
VLFLDLDRFKIINDSLGHVIGDKLLVALAQRLRSSIRPGDVVARLGGDEFTVLLNRTGDIKEVARVAERLQSQISEPFKIDNYEVFTTASIGVIIADDLPREADDFLRDADTAMYRAKEAGKARYEIFDREMHAHNLNVLQLETDLRHAVERNEFNVFYQPIVDLTDGRVREFEALIRWRHPHHGLISPDTFIQVAEETGMIIPIGKWILEMACRHTSEWQKATATRLSTSVNLSAKQLLHPKLMSQIREVLDDTELDPRQLKLEVTESTVMENSDRSLSVLSELSDLGVSLSTDDFGTGYSSLSYLHRFPFSRLKIDRSFINKMDEDEKSAAIVKTILLLGENLDIEVVAEGIETEYQLEILRSLGCRLGQGYIFSQPVDAASAFNLLAQPFELPGSAFSINDAVQVFNSQEIQ